MQNFTTFDSAESIAEIHLSIKNADIFHKLRSLTKDDFYVIPGYFLMQPKIVAEKLWGEKYAIKIF